MKELEDLRNTYDASFFLFNDDDLVNQPLHEFSNKCSIDLSLLFESYVQELGDKLVAGHEMNCIIESLTTKTT